MMTIVVERAAKAQSKPRAPIKDSSIVVLID